MMTMTRVVIWWVVRVSMNNDNKDYDVEPYNEEERGRFTAGEDDHDKDGDGEKKGWCLI